MSDTNKAVFLSYASQDAAAARRICDALRATGVEVWFDQNELVGGDAWDAKIRKQISECALFVPIISANTQARLEGYFRIEWKIAARRTHAMATAKTFLLPVVIDGTRDADAHVPDEFREVQWTQLPGGEPTAAFCTRVARLVAGNVVAGVVDPGPGSTTPATARSTGTALPLPPRSIRTRLVPAALAIATFVALALWQPWRKTPSPAAAQDASARSTASKPGPETAADLAEQARSHYYPFSTPASLQLADELSRRATNLDPQYARGWAARANANACYLLRSFVTGEVAQERARDAQSFANQALNLDQNETEALIALGIVAMRQHASTQAETLFRRVLIIDPNNVRAPSLLSVVLRETGRNAEAVTLMKRAVANAPRDPIVHLFLGFTYWAGWNLTKAAAQFDTAASIADFQPARVYQAWVTFLQTSDLARLRAMLESVNLIYSAEDAKLSYLLLCGLYERRGDRVLEAVGRTASTYFDGEATPKAWYSALAYEFDHKDNLARQQWLAAEAVIRERLRAEPQGEMLRMNLAITLAKLGRTAEARAEFDAIEAVWREQPTATRATWLARFCATTGDAPRAVKFLRQGINDLNVDPEGLQNATNVTIQFDPWWDPIRNSAEFRELLAHPPAPPAPVDEPRADGATTTTPEGKSVAALPAPASNEKSLVVLPLENLSPDPENAFFTDGMHAEMINALSRITGLKVISRTSSLRFKGTTASLADIAQQVGVANVITGSVRRAEGRVKIELELRRARDEALLLTKTYDRELRDAIAIQTEVAGDIAQALEIRESRGSFEWARYQTKNPEAYDLYLKAVQRYLAPWGNGAHALAEAEACTREFQRVLDLDPNFAAAASFLSRAHSEVFGRTADAAAAVEHARLARKWAEEFARLMPGGGGDGALSLYYSNVEYRPARGAEFAENVIRALPNDAAGHYYMSVALAHRGRVAEAAGALRHGLELDPLNVTYCRDFVRLQTELRHPNEAELALAQYQRATGGNGDPERVRGWRFVLTGELPLETPGLPALWLFRLRRFAACVQACDTARASNAGWDLVNLVLVRSDACARLGRAEDAKSSALEALELIQGIKLVADARNFAPGFRARALAVAGRLDEALEMNARGAADYAALGNVPFIFDIDRAVMLARASRTGECVALLQKLLRAPSGLTVPMLKVDPLWDNVRDDPAFQALLADPKNSAPL